MLKRNFAATTAQIGSPRILIDQPHFLKPVDWASVIDEYQSDVEEAENKEKLDALANALQTGDEEIINSALAAQNPTGYAERLHQMKVAKEKREQELSDKEMQHQRNLALESHRNDLATRREDAAHERTLALEQLKRDWNLEDKAREREQALEDAEVKRQDFYAQEAFKKDIESQYKKQNPEKLPNALYYANELDKLDPNNPAHQPRIKILEGLLAKEMAITGGKTNVAKEIQLLNLRASLDPKDPAQAEQIKLIDSVLNNQKQGTPAKEIQLFELLDEVAPDMPKEEKANLIKSAIGGKQQQQKDTRTTEEKNYEFYKRKGLSDQEALDRATKTGKFAPNQGKPAKTPEQIFNEEKAKAEARAEVEQQVSRRGLEKVEDRALNAVERGEKALESGTGLGYWGGLASEFGASTETGQKNRADIQTANTQMNLVIRQALKDAGVQSKELDAAVESIAYRYTIDPRDDERTSLRKLESFKEDFLSKKQPTKAQQKKPVKILSITEEK